MKKITTLITLLILVGCNSTQTNIEVDSVDTFNLDNYSDFSIKINESSISAEINPINLERFKDNLKTIKSLDLGAALLNLKFRSSRSTWSVNYSYVLRERGPKE